MTKETKTREEAIKKYWSKAKEKCPFNDETLQNGYLEGFIEGAAEVMQDNKWHDLRKDPNDLPKVVTEYITNIGVMTFDRLKDRHLWTTPLCDACDYCEEVTDEVIAWCEIPQFKE